VNIAWDLTENVNLYAGINNLFDEKPAFGYGDNSSYPVSAMGRFFYAGARMNFGANAK
jgi:outer membrane receptor protein involved in Fe transport